MATKKNVISQLEESLKLLEVKNPKELKNIEDVVQCFNIHIKYLLFERDALERERDFWITQALQGE